MTHPVKELDDTIHQRVRLGILALLMESRRADFAYLRDTLELSDGNLSQHLRVLEEGGYVSLVKAFEGNKPRTWVSATRSGRAALDSELETLRSLLKSVDGSRKRGNGGVQAR